MRFNLLALIAIAVLQSACTPNSAEGDKFLIGNKLKGLSSLTGENGQNVNRIVVFDKTVNRLQQFNLDSLRLERSLPTPNPGGEHSVLFDARGNYAIDFTDKNMTVFDSEGNPRSNPVRYIGTPKSAAFRPSKGLLVMYDDLSSVSVLKMGSKGEVTSTWVGGPQIISGAIAAGDIDNSGRLVLGMSDGYFNVIDLEQTLINQNWYADRFFTLLEGINWVAPVRGDADRVMVVSKDKISILNVATHSVESELAIKSNRILKYGKSPDPHIVLAGSGYDFLQVVYFQGGDLKMKEVRYVFSNINETRLDLANNNWSIVDATAQKYTSSGQSESAGRLIVGWRVSDMLAVNKDSIADGYLVELAMRSVFTLSTVSPLGYAVNYDLVSGKKSEIPNFNLPFIR